MRAMWIGSPSAEQLEKAKAIWNLQRPGTPWPLNDLHGFVTGSDVFDQHRALDLLTAVQRNQEEGMTPARQDQGANLLKAALGPEIKDQWKAEWGALLLQRAAQQPIEAPPAPFLEQAAAMQPAPDFNQDAYERTLSMLSQGEVVSGGGTDGSYQQGFAGALGLAGDITNVYRQYRGMPRYDIWLNNVISFRNGLLKAGAKQGDQVIKDLNKSIAEMSWELKHHPDVAGF